MQSPSKSNKQNLKRLRSLLHEMPENNTDANVLDNCTTFPIEEIVQYPLPGYGVPTLISFSPDDNLIAYLFSPDQTLYRKLFVFDPKSGKHELFFCPSDGGLDENNLSAEEKLRRERSRERGLGVTRYEWVKTSSKRKRVMVVLPAGVYIQDTALQPELKLPSASCSAIIDPHVSPDGTMLAYVRDNELHVLNLLYNVSKQLTMGANEYSITHGLAEYIAQEEMDRKNGYWWSLDSKYIAFTEVDSSDMPLFRIMHQGKNSVGSDAQEDHACPFAGNSNVKVHLGVISATGGPVTWMDLLCGQSENEEYLARVNWMRGNILTAQLVCDSWINTVDMRSQYLRSKGILVWKMDNRGTARRGLKFEGAIKYNCGQIDAEDQLIGAEWLIKQGLAKPDHIGLYGWSYGGYLSAITLARFPEVFKCAVAGAPVTSWDGYDTFYTEKYMGLPSENITCYLDGSVMHHVDTLKGKLLIVHGMIDENVHFRHTARLVNALVVAGKTYELLIFPDEFNATCLDGLGTVCTWRRGYGILSQGVCR
ncbi:hypothetical protein DH2020_048547 [Rehmannia glutinosa]|uniref:Uncharacterized protein n=1 Tax=Rehmannia glutinosa TaxID=99300 RepID=A0ABR0U5B4_REHGL